MVYQLTTKMAKLGLLIGKAIIHSESASITSLKLPTEMTDSSKPAPKKRTLRDQGLLMKVGSEIAAMAEATADDIWCLPPVGKLFLQTLILVTLPLFKGVGLTPERTDKAWQCFERGYKGRATKAQLVVWPSR